MGQVWSAANMPTMRPLENQEAVREAVTGYMRSMNLMLADLLKTNRQWREYSEFETKTKAAIAELDRKVFALLHRDGVENPPR